MTDMQIYFFTKGDFCTKKKQGWIKKDAILIPLHTKNITALKYNEFD